MAFRILVTLAIAYLIGGIPVGLFIVKMISGKDVRHVGSGRVGGTNAMRAAGLAAGVLTAALDAGKGILAGYLASVLVPGNAWVKVAAVIFAVVGQVYSVFLVRRNSLGKRELHGGAGGSTTLGGAISLFPLSWAIILPLALLVFVFIGYASVTTISIAFFALVIFVVRAISGAGPWVHALYGGVTLIIVLIALQPNLKRLKHGTERVVGLRAWRKKKAENKAQ